MRSFGWGRPVVALVGFAVALGAVAGCGDSGGGDDTSAAGSWGSTEEGQPNLELAEDGAASGSDGCNELSGTWEESDDGVTFGQWAATQMFCDGVDTWLGGAASATLDGDQLVVLDADGAEIGTLDRA